MDTQQTGIVVIGVGPGGEDAAGSWPGLACT